MTFFLASSNFFFYFTFLLFPSCFITLFSCSSCFIIEFNFYASHSTFLSFYQIYESTLLQQNLQQFKNFLFISHHFYPWCQTFYDDITFVKICISVRSKLIFVINLHFGIHKMNVITNYIFQFIIFWLVIRRKNIYANLIRIIFPIRNCQFASFCKQYLCKIRPHLLVYSISRMHMVKGSRLIVRPTLKSLDRLSTSFFPSFKHSRRKIQRAKIER